ncbi:MAG: exodeoxyribonuclease VII large subunit [Dehalococcoidia bacterium]
MQGVLPIPAVIEYLQQLLGADELLSDLWVVGEVSGYSRSQVGHRYFNLRDGDASLRSVLFRYSVPELELKNGERVIAHGRVGIYRERGELQFVCSFARPEGVGILAARFEELKLRLETEGLFATERKRPLPAFPMRIGLVTSTAAAALQDIRTVLERRWPVAEVVLAPALVQGAEAPAEIAEALAALAAEPGLDLVIVARGGGSPEDLAAFNSEVVARAIYGMPFPVVTGIGHETDTTIADLVADLRAPTPSGAAERATPDIRDMSLRIRALDRAMATIVGHAVATAAERVTAETRILGRAAPQPEVLRAEVAAVVARLGSVLVSTVERGRQRTDAAAMHLGALNPHATLMRGFAIVQAADSGKIVNSVKRVKSGARLSVSVTDGAFWTEVS